MKISDSPIFPGMKTRFTAPKKFDCLWMKTPYAFVVVCFYIPRQCKTLYFIDVDNFIKMREEALPKKSITKDKMDCSRFVSQTVSLKSSKHDKQGILSLDTFV